MALRVVEQAGVTDVGRQREANEDNLVLAAPIFAVADGMGGARAGEVASRLATEAFEDPLDEAATPEQQLTAVAQTANRRIFELSQSDEAHRGMGTTLTAALVSGRGVSIGHVGDSRAYRLRGPVLEQLTHDHSLVAELERSGQLTAEAAERHPQRSIITRALGPEADVVVDTHTHPARDGDVYLLCSDGLTGMVSDDEMAALLRASSSLEEAATSLVRAANQSGGKDNITVVLFRVADDREVADEPADDDTIHRGLTVDDVQTAVREQERAAPYSSSRSPAARQRKSAAPGGPTAARIRVRRGIATAVALAAVGALIVGAYLGGREVYFVATDDDGIVTVYRGLPYELPLGIELYEEEYRSGVPAQAIPSARRERVLDHEWRSRADAEDLVRQLESGSLDPGRTAR